MKIFLDGADCDVLLYYRELGLVHGVTTNPEIIAIHAVSKNPFDLLKKVIATMGNDYVFVQVAGKDPNTQVEEAKLLSALGPNIVIKVLMDHTGLRSIPKMVAAGLQVSATAVNSIGRAILAAEAGAHFIIPYYGWFEDTAEEPTHFLEDVAAIYAAQKYSTKLHVYCRRVDDVRRAAKAGAWGVLLQPADLERFFHHAQSNIAVNGHRAAWDKQYGDHSWLDFTSPLS